MEKTLERLNRELCDSIGGLSSDQTQARRAPASWSIQQIVEHLLLSYATTREVVMVRVQKGTPTKARPSIPQRLGQIMIVTLGRFPSGRLAPPAVDPTHMPSEPLSGEQLSAKVGDALVRMDEALADAERLFGSSKRAVSHIVLGPMSVAQWRGFHLVHGEHHVKQIAAIRTMPTNPLQ